MRTNFLDLSDLLLPFFCFQRLQLQALFILGVDMKDKSA